MREPSARKKIYHQVISADINVARANNAGIRKAQDEQITLSEQHNLNVKTLGLSYQRNAGLALADANRQGGSLGKALSGLGLESAKAMNEGTQSMQKWANFSERSAATAEVQAGGATDSTGADLMAQQQAFSVSLQQIALNNLSSFKTALDESLKAANAVAEALNDLATGIAKHPIKSLLESLTPFLMGLALAIPPMQKNAGMSGSNPKLGPGGPGSRYEAPGSTSGRGGILAQGVGTLKGTSNLVKGLGVAGTVLGAAMLYNDISDISEQQRKGTITEKQANTAKGRATGSVTGAAAGALIGTAIMPVIGTVIGGYIGSWLGEKGGALIGEAITATPAANTKLTNTSISNAPALTPDQKASPTQATKSTTTDTTSKSAKPLDLTTPEYIRLLTEQNEKLSQLLSISQSSNQTQKRILEASR